MGVRKEVSQLTHIQDLKLINDQHNKRNVLFSIYKSVPKYTFNWVPGQSFHCVRLAIDRELPRARLSKLNRFSKVNWNFIFGTYPCFFIKRNSK